MLLRVSIPPQWQPFPSRGGLIPGYELWLRGWSLLGPLGGSFFFVSCPATHLHHLRHHLDAVESVTGFFRLHHFPHHVRKRRPFEKARKFFWGILLILNHFDFPPFLGGSWPPASLAFSTYKTKVPEERLHPCGLGENHGSRQNCSRYFCSLVLWESFSPGQSSGPFTPSATNSEKTIQVVWPHWRQLFLGRSLRISRI